MEKKLDLRGLSCPIPLIRTRDALAAADVVTVVVDEQAPRENIIKFAKTQNCSVDCTTDGGEYTIVIRK
ncbi:MAG TPA: sulfurtransferase TusA family protein [Negativicutes bacterium]|nr:sulfurtransferase TusA family protein [Negativicutes bacterium]